MSEIKVELSAEDLNKAIADAIVKSVLGETIVKMVNEYVKTISSSYNNPIKTIVEQSGKDLIIQLVHARRKEFEIELEKRITPQVAEALVNKAVEKLLTSNY
jgi:hypothetical protein